MPASGKGRVRACHTAILGFCQKRAQFCCAPGRFWPGALAISRCARTHAHARQWQDRSGGPRPSALSPIRQSSPYTLGLSTRLHPAPARFHVPVGTECFTSVSELFLRRNTGTLEGTDNGKPPCDTALGTLGRCMREMVLSADLCIVLHRPERTRWPQVMGDL